ncbi:MAG: SRPBCC family protein [Novosphingobium sp.]
MRQVIFLLGTCLTCLAAPASAEVTQRSDAGFIVRITSDVSVSPAEAWKLFATPSRWWSGQHTFSGEAANLTLDPVAGGCLCETLPAPKDAPATQKAGSVLHLRVIYAEPYRALRLTGGLGPLQSEAVNGTMTVTFKAVDDSNGKATRILWEYVVGGYMRYKSETISGAVDRMLSAQLASLTKLVGPFSAAPVVSGQALIAEPVTDATEPAERFVPDPARDDEAAAESVRSALDRIFPKKGARANDGR